jgi:DNA-binding SARP family transcriptional activator
MAGIEFRLLGPLEVLRDGAPVAVPPGRPRALLGRLLVSANKVVAADHLIEDLWRGDPPASAGHALRVYVSNLRRLLEPERVAGVTPQVLVTRPPGYLLAAEPRQTDAGRFELLVAEGLRWRTQEAWSGERPDPAFAARRGRSSTSTRRRLRAVS